MSKTHGENRAKLCKSINFHTAGRDCPAFARDSLRQGPGLRAIVCLNSRRHCATSRAILSSFLSFFFPPSPCMRLFVSPRRVCVYTCTCSLTGEKEDSRNPSGTFVRCFSLLLPFSFFLREDCLFTRQFNHPRHRFLSMGCRVFLPRVYSVRGISFEWKEDRP